MVFEALKAVSESLNHYLKSRFGMIKDKVMLSSIITDNSSPSEDKDKIAVTLINVQNEKTIQRGHIVPGMRPPIYLNLFVLFSVYYGEDGSYEESLKELSAIVSFFQSNNVMDQQNSPSLDPAIDKLIFEFVNQDMQSLNYIWSMLGGKYVPSVLYKVRMITIQEGIAAEFPIPFSGLGQNG
jgi:hypothetical protein